jgi:hypothetical protein
MPTPEPSIFGTKAETLDRLRGLVSTAQVPSLYFFTREAWGRSSATVLEEICSRFPGQELAIRSSALAEDGAHRSMAGAFLSLLGISASDEPLLRLSIEKVLASMGSQMGDQVLVQSLVKEIAVSGVIMTYDMVNGAPYYCIDYDDESGRTDIVTGGNGINKGLFVYRDAGKEMIRSTRVAAFLALAEELERLCDCLALDIEFGLDRSGQLHLFQVRRIALAKHWHPATERRVKRKLAFAESFIRERSLPRHGVLGDRTILAVMPDWNPAEIIGTTPRPLAASLYRELITHRVWTRAREAMGYRAVGDSELMLLINNHPYIDVRNSFNSFLPAQVPDVTGAKLVNAWLDRLETHTEFHDKVEFEIVPTCLDFGFEAQFEARYDGLLSSEEREDYREALTDLTRNLLRPGPESTLDQALASSGRLRSLQLPLVPREGGHGHLARAFLLIQLCLEHGTLPFAIAARHAFVAEALLRSSLQRGALGPERLAAFKRSIRTVTGEMVGEMGKVYRGSLSREAFLTRYGHLRPGTYEITSLRYDEREDLFSGAMPEAMPEEVPEFTLSARERRDLDALLRESSLDVLDADGLLDYAHRAIAGREQVKFDFTRILSDALSELVHWGETQGLSRDDLSFLDWTDIARSIIQPVMDEADRHFLDIAETGRRSVAAAFAFRLSHIISSPRDIYVATLNRSVPNFIGSGAASGRVVELNANTPASFEVRDRIVCIENADPGFDWIFARQPLALITRFGGSNSHMAIRCAEFGLPAAIGCGEQIFLRIVASGAVELNCPGKILRPLYDEH